MDWLAIAIALTYVIVVTLLKVVFLFTLFLIGTAVWSTLAIVLLLLALCGFDDLLSVCESLSTRKLYARSLPPVHSKVA